MRNITEKIFITLLLALILIGLFGVILPKNPDKFLSDRFWALKVHSNKKYNFIILGDSRSYRGVSPKEIEEILPEFDVLNFAFSNGGLNNTIYAAAEKRFQSDAKYKIILIGLTPLTINNLTADNKQYAQELKRGKEEILERIYLGQFFNFFSPVTPQTIQMLFTNRKENSYYNSLYYDNGWVSSNKFPLDTLEAMPYYEKDFSEQTTSYQLLDELCTQIKLWKHNGIEVFAFRPPASLPLVDLENNSGKFNEDLVIQKLNSAGCNWIYISPNSYKTYDGSHLSESEARKLSKELALKIRKIYKFAK